MARLRVADGGDDLLIWKVAGNTLNKNRGQLTMGCPAAWELGEELTTHRKKQLVTKCYTEPRTWMHLVQDREQWRALVNTVMDLRVP